MRRLRRTETFAAWGAVAALLLAPLTATSAAAADTVVASDDFSAPLSAAWQQSGGPTLEIVDVEGDPALQVGARANDFDGVETAPGTIVAGETYTVSARIRLAADVTGTREARFVHDFGATATPRYGYVGDSNRTISATEWTTITGTIVVPDAATAPKFYIGTSNSDPAAAYAYLVDDLVITSPEPAPPAETVVSDDDFSAPLGESWQQSGGPTLSIVDVEGDPALRVADRVQDFDGIETAPGVLDAGATYTVSARIRLAAGTVGAPEVRFVQNFTQGGTSQFVWVPGSNAAVSADAWTTVTGTFVLPADATAPKIYLGTGGLDGAYTYLVDDLLLTTTATEPGDGDGGGPSDPGTPGAVVLETSFEDGLDGWQLRRSSSLDVAPTVSVTTDQARTGIQSAVVDNRGSQGDGIGIPVVGTLLPGITYDLSAWVRFAAGQPVGDIWVTLQADSAFLTQAQVTGLSSGEWREVAASITMPAGELETGLLYFETAYDGGAAGNTSTFYVDDVSITQAEQLVVQELTPIKDTVPFPIGVAIDSRETSGAQAELVNRHFEQVSSENFMKPEAFYNAEREFTPNAEGDLLMDFAADNDLRVWGHTLVWHAQTPAWFFQNAEGAPLSTSDADKQALRDRMRQHIFDVAGYYAGTHGLYGAENPIVAFDVVNEVVNDGAQYEDGLRRSEWYRILGEEFIDLAFQYADEAFNDVYAAEGADRPVALFINDYNTEQEGKQNRMRALLERMIDRGVAVDGLGHQFHVSLSFPVDALGAAIDRFADLPITQAVTELDVTTGTPESEALFVDQGYYYRDAFRDFRERAEELYSVTIWGLTDNRSWRSDRGGPLLFDARLQAKPAYYGVIDGELEAPLRSANVFGAVVDGVDDPQWQRMPATRVDDEVAFKLRWAGDALTVLVEVADATPDAGDAVELELDGTILTVERSDAQRDSAEGWATVVELPLGGAGEGETVGFDLRRFDGGEQTGAWNAPGNLGTLTLLEELSFVEVVETGALPSIDGAIEAAWAAATVVETGKQVEGTSGATATVRTLWSGDRLLVLMEVADPIVDVSGSDPWIQDSVEIYVDAGNAKNGPYRYDDTQIRISAENVVSFGAGGDEAFQRARVESATALVDGGYVVEASISLLDSSGLGTVHGLDFQVNDASDGARTSIRNWADPSGAGFQSTARWGVGQLVAAPVGEPAEVAIELGARAVAAGATLPFAVTGAQPGQQLVLTLDSAARGLRTAAVVELGAFTADGDGAVEGVVRIPSGTAPGAYTLSVVSDGQTAASAAVAVTAAAVADPGNGAPGSGALPVTGSASMGPLAAVALLLVMGGAAMRARRNGERAV